MWFLPKNSTLKCEKIIKILQIFEKKIEFIADMCYLII